MKMILTLLVCLVTSTAFATLPTLIFKNQFGEQTNATIIGGTGSLSSAIAANSILSNLTGSSAAPVANSYALVSAKLTPAMLLTGYSAAPGVVASTDTVLQALQKLAGNQPVVIECAASAGGAATEALTCTGLASTDTILAVTQRVKGANSTALNAYASLVTNGITASWTADPGSGAVVRVTVKH